MPAPARITIELEPPPTARGRWRTRTHIEGAVPARRTVVEAVVPVEAFVAVDAVEPREPAVVPAPYEPPAECTCVEGYCDTDHANE